MSKSIYHNHHIIPKHLGGTDDPSNLIQLTIAEHAAAHKKLYEEHDHWQDKLAWQGLAGMIGKEEIIRQVISNTHKGKTTPEETKKKQSAAKMGKLNPMYGTVSPNRGKFGKDNPSYGNKHTPEVKARMSAAAKKRCANMTVAERQNMTAKGRATRIKNRETYVHSLNV